MVPCSIASTEHGTYVALVIDQKDDNGKTTMQPLNAFDEVQNGEIVQFSCDEGYSVHGPTRLKCQEGSWDVPGLPECVHAPCSLPTIENAVYQVKLQNATHSKLNFSLKCRCCFQGGYRGGLTIAHGSTVSVQCDGSEDSVQLSINS